ncbi:MAG: MFS transporter [Chloroflexota bacterium]
MDTQLKTRRVMGFPANVFFLGLVSFFTDVSSEMIFTLVPLFLSNVLGVAAGVVGIVGGVSESTDAIFRIFSGRISDRLRKRKLPAVLGYSLSTLAKPFMYIAGGWGAVLAVRFGDRVGKGIRSAPRDALIADSVPPGEWGRGFGLHRAMDTSGAVLGLVLAAIIIYLVQRGGVALSLATYRWLVLVGVVPAVLGVVVLLTLVKEVTRERSVAKIGGVPKAVTPFPRRFKLFLGVIAVFTLGNSSDFFVILRAQDLGAPVLQITLMLVLLNLSYAVCALPAGVVSDRMGRKGVIILGWGIYALVYLGFAAAGSIGQVWLLFAAYGLYYGIVEGTARAFVADLVPEERRGTAYGYFQGVVGLALLPASLIAGWLWDAVSPAAPFYLGAGLAFLAAMGLLGLVRE